jgi:hypothetical protein
MFYEEIATCQFRKEKERSKVEQLSTVSVQRSLRAPGTVTLYVLRIAPRRDRGANRILRSRSGSNRAVVGIFGPQSPRYQRA